MTIGQIIELVQENGYKAVIRCGLQVHSVKVSLDNRPVSKGEIVSELGLPYRKVVQVGNHVVVWEGAEQTIHAFDTF